jgi:endonuclease YncB( thermonuclease family)
VEASRDWLVIGGSAPPVAPAAQVYVAPAPAMQVPAAAIEPPAPDLPRAPRVEGASDTPKAQGWFRMLGNAGPVIRIASNGMASRLSGLATGIRGRRELPAGVGMAGEGLRRVAGPVLRASAALVLLLIGGSVVYGLGSLALRSDDPPARTAAVTAPREPTTTGSIAPARPAAEPANVARANDNGPVRGVPEVLDTATLSIHGKVVRLFGIEWVRGAGEPADLASYIRGREVTCEPAKPGATTYRCNVEGQDLSKVVLFNGGGRATSEASADLQAAEAHAKSSRAGLWAKGG